MAGYAQRKKKRKQAAKIPGEMKQQQGEFSIEEEYLP
jgi:hypothetical protein